MRPRVFRITREVVKEECSWLPRPLKKDEVVVENYAPQYGCVSPAGIACTLLEDVGKHVNCGHPPFVEVPMTALSEIECPLELFRLMEDNGTLPKQDE